MGFLNMASRVAPMIILAAAVAACGPKPAPPGAGGAAPAGSAAPAATSAPITAPSGTGGSQASTPQGAARSVTPADKNGPKYGGTLHVYAYDWPHLDPHQTLTAGLHGVAAMPYGYLLRFETGPQVTGLKIIPSMAEKWETPDPKTYIFHLRKGVKWHNLPPVNGREFTADDVIYNVKRISTPGWISAPLLEDVANVEALDKYTVKFTLKGPSAPFLAYMANGYIKMVAKEAVEANGGDLKRGLPIGTGPFMAEEITAKVAAKMKKNPEYWETDAKGGKLPYLDAIDGVIIADSSTRFTALRTGKLDYYTCLKTECEILKKASPEVTITTEKAYSGQQYGLKVNKKPFDDVRVRKAVSLAFDRKTFHETVRQAPYEEGWNHFTFTVPDESWIVPQAEFEKAWAYNLDEAKKLMTDAGYPNGFETTLTCGNYGTDYITACEFLVDGLKKIGIKAGIKVVDQPTYSSSVFAGEGNFEMYYGPQGTFMEPDQWLGGYYHTKGPRNVNKINDAKLDKLIEEQRAEITPEKRKVKLLEIQRYLLDQYYHLHPRATYTYNGVWPWVGNFTTVADYPTPRFMQYLYIDPSLKKN